MVDENFYKHLVDNLYDGVYFVDRQRVITYWNKGAELITGYSGSQVLGHCCYDNILNHVTVSGFSLCQNQCPLTACMEDGKNHAAEVFLHHADGHRIPVSVHAAPIWDNAGMIIGAVETFSSDSGISALHHELDELRHSAQTDPLTGIYNRVFLEGRLRAVLAEVAYRRDMTAGLLFMDIDNFKQVNDKFGHEIGDKVLRMAAATMHHNLLKTDVVGRWGGDEFMAVIYDVETQQSLQNVAEKFRALVECSRLDFPQGSLTVTVSIGATQIIAGDTPETVFHRCDSLMYQSKREGRNRVVVG